MLLEQGQGHSGHYANGHPQKGNQPSLQHEDPTYEPVIRPHRAQGGHILLFFYYQHRQGSEYVQGDDDYYEDEYQEDGGFLVAHHLVEGLILHIAVLYDEGISHFLP